MIKLRSKTPYSRFVHLTFNQKKANIVKQVDVEMKEGKKTTQTSIILGITRS